MANYVKQEELARIVYEQNPGKFEDRVDGICNMAWQIAKEKDIPEWVSAMSVADKILSYLFNVLPEEEKTLLPIDHQMVDNWNNNMNQAPPDKEEILLTNGTLVTPAKFLQGKWMAPGYNGTNMQFHPTGWMHMPLP